MKLWKCTICARVGFWGPEWQSFSLFVVEDEFPSMRIIYCSKACDDTGSRKIEEGTIQLPKFRLTGYQAKCIKRPKGYEPQPEQRDLIKQWNAEHANEPIALEFFTL